MNIDIRVHPKFSGRIKRARLKRLAAKVLRAEKARASLTIYITTDAEMRKLNRQFHATDIATDVLSFPMDDGGDIAMNAALLEFVIQRARDHIPDRALRIRTDHIERG